MTNSPGSEDCEFRQWPISLRLKVIDWTHTHGWWSNIFQSCADTSTDDSSISSSDWLEVSFFFLIYTARHIPSEYGPAVAAERLEPHLQIDEIVNSELNDLRENVSPSKAKEDLFILERDLASELHQTQGHHEVATAISCVNTCFEFGKWNQLVQDSCQWSRSSQLYNIA